MPKHGKKYRQASEKVEQRPYPLKDAIDLAGQVKFAKFDETLELAMRLGVDPKHADQMVRGTVVLPHGLGTVSRVLNGARYVSPESLEAVHRAMRDQGRAYAAACAAAGVDTILIEAQGTIHGFIALRRALPSAQGDIDRGIAALKLLIEGHR